MANLDVDGITKHYPTRGAPLSVLHEVTFRIGDGDSAAVLGPSGCGKSTLLQILGTLQRPSTGSVKLDEVDPFTLDETQLAVFRNEKIGFIFQDHHLLPQLSALENILVPAIATHKASRQQVDRAKELLRRVGLEDRANHRPSELSGGERQRIATARALINGPTLILADEPTGNLDQSNAHQVADLLTEVQVADANSPTMIVVTHSNELAQRFHHRWELNDGRLVV